MDPFVAEIRIFPFNFAPKGWAWCDGQLLPLSQPGDLADPATRVIARGSAGNPYQQTTNANIIQFAPEALAPAGGDQPHNNLQPYLTFYFNIALQGVYPPRT